MPGTSSPAMTDADRADLDSSARGAMFGHSAGDDFDGCSSCWDDQHADGTTPKPCTDPEPGMGGFNDLSAGDVPAVPCINCGHAVSLARVLA